jgi:hypothetical protein
MKGFIIIVVVLVIGYGFVQGLQVFKANGDFAEQVDHELDHVDPTSMDSVKQDVIADAKKFGIDITTNDIHILYEDTDQRTVAQNLVGQKIGVQFINKRVAISVDYKQHVLGISVPENVTQSHVRQVEAPRKQTSPEMQQLLDATPQ